MAILSILASLAGPGLSSILSGKDSAKALDTLSSMATVARQRAMSQGVSVALVLTTPSQAQDLQGQAVTLVGLAKDVAGVTRMSAVAPWTQLPGGVKVESYLRNGADGFYAAGGGSLPVGALPAKLNGGTVSGSYSYIIFRPDGSVDARSSGPTLTFQRKSTGAAKMEYMLVVQEGSGRTKVVVE